MAPAPPPPPVPRRKKGSSQGSGTTGTSDTAPGPGGTGPGAGAQGPSARSPRKGPTPKLQKSLEEALSAPALVYSLAGDQWAANHITNSAPTVAEAWYKLAQESPAVRRVLEKMTTGSAWGAVIFSTGGMVVPLLAHHGLLPAQVGVLLGGEQDNGGPIVPPPPAPQGPPPGASTREGRGAPVTNGMTPPLREDQPPGVVTVAGTGAVIN